MSAEATGVRTVNYDASLDTRSTTELIGCTHLDYPALKQKDLPFCITFSDYQPGVGGSPQPSTHHPEPQKPAHDGHDRRCSGSRYLLYLFTEGLQ